MLTLQIQKNVFIHTYIHTYIQAMSIMQHPMMADIAPPYIPQEAVPRQHPQPNPDNSPCPIPPIDIGGQLSGGVYGTLMLGAIAAGIGGAVLAGRKMSQSPAEAKQEHSSQVDDTCDIEQGDTQATVDIEKISDEQVVTNKFRPNDIFINYFGNDPV